MKPAPPLILFRHDRYSESERAAASKFFHVVGSRMECHNGLVIPRYSALPFYKELEADLAHNGCVLPNTYEQHRWIADFQYYETMKEFTPETWDEHEFPYCDHPGPFVVKFRTNSKKYMWKTHMYAETKADAVEVALRLQADSMMSDQGLIYRKFEKTKVLETSPSGMPFTNEWRFFYWCGKLVSYGYYWSNAQNPELGVMNQKGLDFAHKLAQLAKPYVNFYVLDIAEKENGDWILIEMNDGQMSGLSEIPEEQFYANLLDTVNNVAPDQLRR